MTAIGCTWRSVAAVVAVLMLAATGCFGGGRGSGSASSDRPQPEEPRRGGILRLGITPPASLDPARARTVEELLVADQLFDSLTAFDPETLAPTPSIAARWEASPDQRQWQFFLRSGATFADGGAITSADVKYSLERVARKDSGSSVPDLLESIAGFAAFSVEGSAAELAGVTAPAPDVVRIELDEPLSELPALLGNAALGIVPRSAVEAQPPLPAFAEKPLGSGPFVVSARSGTAISLLPAAGSPSLVAGIDLVLFDTVDASYRAFVNGDVDWSQVPVDRVESASQRFGRAAFRPYMAVLFYGFNLSNPKFADRRFREAIVRAINRSAIVSSVYNETVLPTDGLVPAGLSGYQRGVCGEPCLYDPARAKALLAEVFGETPPPGFHIDYDDDTTQAAVAKAMQADLAAVGIPTVLRPMPLEDYQSFAVSGAQELFRLGWIAAYPSSDAVLTPLFLSGQASNLTAFSVPAVDAALLAARSEPSVERRLDHYRAAERAIISDLPVVPLAQFRIHAVVSPRVRDLVLTAAGSFDGARVWLASGA